MSSTIDATRPAEGETPAASAPIRANFAAAKSEIEAIQDLLDPHDVGYDIWLLAGQSNMAGRCAIQSAVDTVDSRVFQFAGASFDSSTYRKIIAASDPLKSVDSNPDGSPGTWFGKSLALMTQKNRLILLVPVAQGGTALVGNTWASGNPGGDLYENAISQANLAITAAQLIYPQSRFKGVAWIQGESDGDASVSQSAYDTALRAVITGFRARITGATSSLFVIGGMVPEAISNRAGYPAIDAAHQAVASSTIGCAYAAGPSGYTSDNLHYNVVPASRIMGARMANAVLVAEASLTGTVTSLRSLSWNILQSVTSLRSLSWDVGVISVTSLRAFGWDVQAAASNYDFESDTTGQNPANTTVTSGTFNVVNSGVSGWSGKYLRTLTAGGNGQGVIDFANLTPSSADQTLTWKSAANTTVRDGFLLRPQSSTPNPSFTPIKNGYYFQVHGINGVLRIYNFQNGSVTSLGNDNSCNMAIYKWFRASCIGSTIKFEASTNGTSWTTFEQVTDTTHTSTSGAIQYANGFDGTVTDGYVDDIVLS